MEGSLRELAMYRIERAEEMIRASEDNLNMEQYRTSLKRSYYAVFHAMRAANCLEEYDSSKHSGVIAFFTKIFLKTEEIDRSMAKIIKESPYLRKKSDYDDFYIANKSDVVRQLSDAKKFVKCVKEYILTRE